jgi:AraC family transcriptional regulator of arabinose operon
MVDPLSRYHRCNPMPRDRALAAVITIGTAVQDARQHTYVSRERWHSWQFMLCVRGEGEFEVDGRRFTSTTDSAVILPRDRPHRYRRGAGCAHWEYRWVEFDGEQAPTLLAMLGLADACVVPGCGEALSHIELVHALLVARGDAALHEATTLFLHALAVVARIALQRPEAEPSAVKRATAWMARNLHAPVDLADLARAAGVSPWHCVRLFRATHGVPPMTYLRSLRVHRAKALLHDGDMGIRQVARAVGYARVQHFTRMFTRVVGMPPGEFRRGTA